MKSKLSVKKEIEKNIDEYYNCKVKCEESAMRGEGSTYDGHDFDYWDKCSSFQEAKLLQLKEDVKEELKFLEKLQKIINKYHSNIPMVEVGRQNILNDIDNELNLDKRIEQLKKILKCQKK